MKSELTIITECLVQDLMALYEYMISEDYVITNLEITAFSSRLEHHLRELRSMIE